MDQVNFDKSDFKKENFDKSDFSLKKFNKYHEIEGQRISNAIHRQGLEFCDVLDLTGFSPIHLTLITKGYIKASWEECEALAKALGDPITAKYLFNGEE